MMISEKDNLYKSHATLLKIAGKAAKQEDLTMQEMGIVQNQLLEISLRSKKSALRRVNNEQ